MNDEAGGIFLEAVHAAAACTWKAMDKKSGHGALGAAC
jgi:hypothetical protein